MPRASAENAASLTRKLFGGYLSHGTASRHAEDATCSESLEESVGETSTGHFCPGTGDCASKNGSRRDIFRSPTPSPEKPLGEVIDLTCATPQSPRVTGPLLVEENVIVLS